MKSSASTILNSLLGYGNLNMLWNTVGLKLIGWTTRIILLVGSEHFVHHSTNYGTVKTSGMQPYFTNPLALRHFLRASSVGKLEYQLYALDQWNSLLIFASEFVMSQQNGSLLFLLVISWIKILASYIGQVLYTCKKNLELCY